MEIQPNFANPEDIKQPVPPERIDDREPNQDEEKKKKLKKDEEKEKLPPSDPAGNLGQNFDKTI